MKHYLYSAALLGLITTQAKAQKYPDLTEFVEKNVRNISLAINSSSIPEYPGIQGKFEFKRFLLRINAKVGFEAPIGKIELIPELELVFQKEKI